jgi:hypothetical protein
MFMLNYRWLLLLLPLIGCSSEPVSISQPQATAARVMEVKANHKYKLEAVFSGTDVKVGERTLPVIEQLIVRNAETGREVKYSHSDGPSASDAHAYFTDVWSPGDEYLVVPLDRFRGFCIIRAAEVLELVQKQACSDTIRVRTETGTGLWHQFVRWDNSEAFSFKAGLENSMNRFQYDISRRRLIALDRNSSFQGENGKGQVEITTNQ